ncbi:hypothetical protein BJ138DRAFT_1014509, partial [Hygrophoropsis aurantiaca]
LWPKGIGNLDGERLSIASLEPWQKVPSTYAEICTWAQLARDPTSPEKRRENIIIYCNPPTADPLTLFPISIRVQGFLESCCLRPLGNWKGLPESECFTIFLIMLITCLRCQRKSDDPVTALSIADDPNQCYPTIAPDWCLADRLQIGRRLENGNRAACSHMILMPGDFIDVGLTFDVVRQKQKDGSTSFKIHLGFSHVLQLASAEVLSKVSFFLRPSSLADLKCPAKHQRQQTIAPV